MQYISGEKRERDDLAEETIRLFKKEKAEETKQLNEKHQRKLTIGWSFWRHRKRN